MLLSATTRERQRRDVASYGLQGMEGRAAGLDGMAALTPGMTLAGPDQALRRRAADDAGFFETLGVRPASAARSTERAAR